MLWNKATQTDLLFVTLEKSDKDYSPTTRYADYPISPILFHWESQNTASPDTPTGRRYIEQPDRGTNVVLFVRERKRDSRGETLPYHCLGRARYRNHEIGAAHEDMVGAGTAHARVALPGGESGRRLRHSCAVIDREPVETEMEEVERRTALEDE